MPMKLPVFSENIFNILLATRRIWFLYRTNMSMPRFMPTSRDCVLTDESVFISKDFPPLSVCCRFQN